MMKAFSRVFAGLVAVSSLAVIFSPAVFVDERVSRFLFVVDRFRVEIAIALIVAAVVALATSEIFGTPAGRSWPRPGRPALIAFLLGAGLAGWLGYGRIEPDLRRLYLNTMDYAGGGVHDDYRKYIHRRALHFADIGDVRLAEDELGRLHELFPDRRERSRPLAEYVESLGLLQRYLMAEQADLRETFDRHPREVGILALLLQLRPFDRDLVARARVYEAFVAAAAKEVSTLHSACPTADLESVAALTRRAFGGDGEARPPEAWRRDLCAEDAPAPLQALVRA